MQLRKPPQPAAGKLAKSCAVVLKSPEFLEARWAHALRSWECGLRRPVPDQAVEFCPRPKDRGYPIRQPEGL